MIAPRVARACHSNESAVDGASARRKPTTASRSRRSEFYIIARLDAGDSAADIYSRIVDVPVDVHHTGEWARSLPVQPGTVADLNLLDHMLAAAGYRRSSGWRQRITTSGAVRYFADATTPSQVRRRAR
ncbi:hypothetical protein ACGFQG_29935 [Nocardia fluminea]|uniref:hypothetical protein n=1 Tax=Nocardia fluminea TaxID=134984 RepID=UPI0033CF0735